MKTVEKPDDYETMREVIRRRYTRVLKDKLPLPDLILVDGGKGQMSAALDVLEDELGLSIPLCGIAKNEKHKTSELLYGNPPEPVPLKRNEQPFYLIQRIQDEVHRFAITFHRNLRGKSATQSSLDEIEGVGPKENGCCYNTLVPLKKLNKLKKKHSQNLESPTILLKISVIIIFSKRIWNWNWKKRTINLSEHVKIMTSFLDAFSS